MPCKHLKTGWRWKNGRIYESLVGTRIGKEPTTRPCGQCVDCRLDKTREMAIRCKHEGSLYSQNCVVTLTYDDEHLPPSADGMGTIDPTHGPKFMKDLRAKIQYEREKIHLPWHPSMAIKAYGCAEYGCNDPRCGKRGCNHNMRPHNHIILFNYDFEDKKLDYTEDGRNYYTSDILEQIWGKGGCQIMDLNWETAAYVARYVMKKITGPGQQKYEEKRTRQGRMKHQYGEKLREQTICISRGGRKGHGIAHEWWEQNYKKIHTNDIMYFNGIKIKPTKYYDKKFEKKEPNKWKKIKEKRENELQKYLEKIQKQINDGDHTNNFQRMDRQRAHEACMEAKAELLKRTL